MLDGLRRVSRVLIAALVATAALSPRPAAQTAETRVIEVVARRFLFEPSQIDVTVGERITLLVKSADGPHGVEIKKFNIKKAIPRGGDPVPIEFTASEAGRFPIACSEYCGDKHDDMKGVLIVQARENAHR
jgi:cytochrome c oxidase subunit 2